jgi:hypothetical protein
MLPTNKAIFFLLLLLVESILIETRFIDFEKSIIKKQKQIKGIQIKINELVKLFQGKIDQNELYSEDALAFAILILEIITKRNRSLTPPVYWYSRKG